MKRIIVFAHFDRDNIVDEYVLFSLRELRKVGDIVFVSTAQIPSIEQAKLAPLCREVIVRENVGYDFMSWQRGIRSVPDIERYDELLICNDSVYGPFFPLENIFQSMAGSDCDFWGMTENDAIAYHIQSYFVVFRKKVLTSAIFRRFWDGILEERTKGDIIEKYEVGLSQTLLKAGFSAGAYVAFRVPIWYSVKAFLRKFIIRSGGPRRKRKNSNLMRILKSVNITHFFWKELVVKYRMPYIKIELLRSNPLNINISGYDELLRNNTPYDVALIKNHLKRIKRRVAP